MMRKETRVGIALAAVALLTVGAGRAFAGDMFLTGHDVLLHCGQAGYDDLIINLLRDGAPQATYKIGVIGSGVGSWGFSASTCGHTHPNYPGNVTYYDTALLNGNGALQDQAVANNLLIIVSHTSCGGCDLSDAGVIVVNSMASKIATRFNAGMDLWANAGADNLSYYNFLPAGFAATGPAIGGSVFCADPAAPGLPALGITNAMTQGFQTHNRFTGFDPTKLSVVETQCPGDPQGSCAASGGPPCNISLYGKNITIGPVPAVSTWGMVAISLLLLTGIAIKFGLRKGVLRAT